MFGLGGESTKPKLFNWMTVALVTGWILVVSVVAEHSDMQKPADDAQEFMIELIH